MQATAKALKKHTAQNPAEQACFSKLCIAAQRVSPPFATHPCDKNKFRMTSYQGTKACCICTTYIFCRCSMVFGRFLPKRDRPEVSFRCLCSIWDKRGHAEPLTLRANHFKRLLSTQLDAGDRGTNRLRVQFEIKLPGTTKGAKQEPNIQLIRFLSQSFASSTAVVAPFFT